MLTARGERFALLGARWGTMSGMCGAVHWDGEPVNRAVLADLTDSMRFRGPDGYSVWSEGNVGFGHAMFKTTHEAEGETQPFTLGGGVWITADARIDDRKELQRKLISHGLRACTTATDATLILLAYQAWGEGCTQHLLGDFAFAIWDGPKQRLFCARDQLGIKQLFYAHVGEGLVFSNTLRTLRRHPLVRSGLNEQAIADFLLFDANQDPSATFFAEVQRLLPATSMTCTREGTRFSTYWSPPVAARIRHGRARDYVAQFQQLLGTAVSDRLRLDKIGVELSGGMDSSAIAATAVAQIKRQRRACRISAHTVVYDDLFVDEERHYAGLVAQHLDLPIHYWVADPFKPYEGAREAQGPEPVHDPHLPMAIAMAQARAKLSRVFLTGWDGDALLSESPRPYLRHLFHEREVWRLLSGMARHVAAEPAVLTQRARSLLSRGATSTTPEAASYPAWISGELEKRLALRARFQQRRSRRDRDHPMRPYAHRMLAYIMNDATFFGRRDAGHTGVALEMRHPFMDLRLWRFCLELPPLPWCVKKHLLRAAMRSSLPEAVLNRPKTTLAGYPYYAHLHKPHANALDGFNPAPRLNRFVARERVPQVYRATSPAAAWINLRPLSLNYWLQSVTLDEETVGHEG